RVGAVFSGSGRALTFAVAPGDALLRPERDFGRTAGVAALSDDLGRVAAAVGIGEVLVFDGATGARLTTIRPSAPPYSLVFSPDRRLIAAGGFDGRVRVLDVA